MGSNNLRGGSVAEGNTILTNTGYKELELRTRVLEQRQAILEANAK